MEDSTEFFSRDEILKAQDQAFEEVTIPEWGGKKVRLRGLSGTARDAFEASLMVGTGKGQKVSTQNIRAKLAALSIVDSAGNQMFSYADIDALGAKSAQALDRIFEVAQRLSGISSDDVEEMAKNSGNDLSDSSS